MTKTAYPHHRILHVTWFGSEFCLQSKLSSTQKPAVERVMSKMSGIAPLLPHLLQHVATEICSWPAAADADLSPRKCSTQHQQEEIYCHHQNNRTATAPLIFISRLESKSSIVLVQYQGDTFSIISPFATEAHCSFHHYLIILPEKIK